MNASEMLVHLSTKDDVVKIEFNPEWRNAVGGYYDYAVGAQLEGEVGTLYTCTDEESRRVLLICKTHFGNVVIFQRYSDGGSGAVTANFSSRLKNILPSGAWSSTEIEQWFSPWCVNIGKTLEHLRKCFERMESRSATAALLSTE